MNVKYNFREVKRNTDQIRVLEIRVGPTSVHELKEDEAMMEVDSAVEGNEAGDATGGASSEEEESSSDEEEDVSEWEPEESELVEASDSEEDDDDRPPPARRARTDPMTPTNRV
jgi:hypothetical protein